MADAASPRNDALGPERRALGAVAGIFPLGILQCGDEIFGALALEFFLRRFEICDARGNFFSLQSEAVRMFGHAHPFDFVPVLFADAIGARIGIRRCRIVIVDKAGRVLVAQAPSR